MCLAIVNCGGGQATTQVGGNIYSLTDESGDPIGEFERLRSILVDKYDRLWAYDILSAELSVYEISSGDFVSRTHLELDKPDDVAGDFVGVFYDEIEFVYVLISAGSSEYPSRLVRIDQDSFESVVINLDKRFEGYRLRISDGPVVIGTVAYFSTLRPHGLWSQDLVTGEVRNYFDGLVLQEIAEGPSDEFLLGRSNRSLVMLNHESNTYETIAEPGVFDVPKSDADGERIDYESFGPPVIGPDGRVYSILSVKEIAYLGAIDIETGEATRIAGTGFPSLSGDGGPALDADLVRGEVEFRGNGDILLPARNRIRIIPASPEFE